jgi:hypothetical protein
MNVIAEPRIAATRTHDFADVFATRPMIGYHGVPPLPNERKPMSEIAWLGSLDEALSAAGGGAKLVLLDVFNPT